MLIPRAKLVVIIQDELPFRNSSSKEKLVCFFFFLEILKRTSTVEPAFSKFAGWGSSDSPRKGSSTPLQKHYYLIIVDDSHMDMDFFAG